MHLTRFANRRRGTLGAAWAIAALSIGGAAAWTTPTLAAPQESQADAERGAELIAEGSAHLEAGRYESASRAFAEALTFLPGNQEAINGQAAAEHISRIKLMPQSALDRAHDLFGGRVTANCCL